MGNLGGLTLYQPIIMDPWINNWNSPDLTTEITVAAGEWNEVLRWNAFDASSDGNTFDILKAKIPYVNMSKIIQLWWK